MTIQIDDLTHELSQFRHGSLFAHVHPLKGVFRQVPALPAAQQRRRRGARNFKKERASGRPSTRPNGRDRVSAFRRISTGQLSVFMYTRLHLRPINLLVLEVPYSLKGIGQFILGLASRLDAFSGYPDRTWLPSNALSRTTGAPEVRPSQSSRTRESAPQLSNAHGR